MQALSFLCRKSVELYQKMLTKKAKAEQAEEDINCEAGVICEDEPDGQDIDLESESDDEWDQNDDDEDDNQAVLYVSPLDEVDEVLNLGSHLKNLEQADSGFYKYLMDQISGEMQ